MTDRNKGGENSQLSLELPDDSPPQQLVLELPFREALDRDNFFISASNEWAVQMIDLWPNWPHPNLFLVGPSGSGKSHLAKVWQSMSGAQIISAKDITEKSLHQLGATNGLIVEDVDKGRIDETLLFHLFNLVKENSVDLLLTARGMPGDWDIKLPDLRSRWRSVPVVTIEPPDDMLLKATLVKHFADRQLDVSPDVINFIALHIDRAMSAARQSVEAIDSYALATGHRVTRNLAKKALGI